MFSFKGIHSLDIMVSFVYIKMSGSESQGQEEAACVCIIRPTQPL